MRLSAMRRAALILALSTPAAAGCAEAARSGPAKAQVDAVVLDETQRAKAAQAAETTASSADAMARVSDGPREQKPTP